MVDTDFPPGKDPGAAAHLGAIEAAHKAVEPCLAALGSLVGADAVADAAHFSTIRFRLARANLARAQAAQKACDHLIAIASGREAEALRDLRAREIEHSQMISQHIGRWTPGAVRGDWKSYCEATRSVLTQIRDLIETERACLLPLLKTAR